MSSSLSCILSPSQWHRLIHQENKLILNFYAYFKILSSHKIYPHHRIVFQNNSAHWPLYSTCLKATTTGQLTIILYQLCKHNPTCWLSPSRGFRSSHRKMVLRRKVILPTLWVKMPDFLDRKRMLMDLQKSSSLFNKQKSILLKVARKSV